MSKRASHWKHKRQFLAQQRQRRRIAQALNRYAQARGYETWQHLMDEALEYIEPPERQAMAKVLTRASICPISADMRIPLDFPGRVNVYKKDIRS